jgi:hypothetical protein
MDFGDVSASTVVRELYVRVFPPGFGEDLDPHVDLVVVQLIVVDLFVIKDESRCTRLSR